MHELLDSSRLDGAVAINRYLGPPLDAGLVDKQSLDDCVAAIEHCCQMWGAAASPLVPIARGSAGVDSPWDELLSVCEIDHVCARGLLPDHQPTEAFYSHLVRAGGPGSNPVLQVIAALGRKPGDFMRVRSCRVPADHPWFVAYAGTLGLLPAHPDAEILKAFNFISDLEFHTLVRTDYETLESDTSDDLLHRVQDHTVLLPTGFSLFGLVPSSSPVDMSLTEGNPVFPWQADIKRNVGPNIVVVYEPGSIDDLCLLWTLRSAHGLPRGFPLAVPITEDVPRVIDNWISGHAATLWQFRGPHVALVSRSVDASVLEAIASQTTSRVTPVKAQEILQPPSMPGRHSSDVATFADGLASVPSWGAADRELIRPGLPPLDSYTLKVRMRPQDMLLPPSRFLQRRTSSWSSGPRGGAWEHATSKPMDIASVRWPSGWTILKGLAMDRGLRVEPSTPGRAAVAILRRLGSLSALTPLLDRAVIAELGRLSQREAMSWFKDRLKTMGKAVAADPDKVLALEKEIDELHLVRREGEDGELVTFGALKNRVFHDKKTAQLWLTWAENSGIVVRGVEVACDDCGSRSWRAIGEATPPLYCRGCGKVIEKPFPVDSLTFAYRASEPLVRLMEHDALVHLLALRFFTELFRPHSNRPSMLIGAHPGVNFYTQASGRLIGEADVVLVFSTGDFAIGECKTSGKGLTPSELTKLDKLGEELGAEFSFLATLARAADCPPLWRDSARALPEKPRFVLTGESLLKRDIIWPAGADPFAWPNDADGTAPTDADRGDAVPDSKRLEWLLAEQSWDRWIFTE